MTMTTMKMPTTMRPMTKKIEARPVIVLIDDDDEDDDDNDDDDDNEDQM